jgi:dihydroorotase-like cyclic amidohydrolase
MPPFGRTKRRNPTETDVLVKNGKIAAIGNNLSGCFITVIDAENTLRYIIDDPTLLYLVV